MRMDRLTSKFQSALADAQSLAVGRDHAFIEPFHLMAALLEQDGSTVRHLLTSTGVNVDVLTSKLNEELDHMAQIEGHQGDIQVSNEMSRLLNVTDKLAQQRKDQYISSELFVLAVVEDKSRLGDLMRTAGATKSNLEKAIEEVRGGQPVDDPNAEDQSQALDK